MNINNINQNNNPNNHEIINNQLINISMQKINNNVFNENQMNPEPKFNIQFNSIEGFKISICISPNSTIEQLLKAFMRRIGLNEANINWLMFLYNTEKLHPKSQERIKDKLFNYSKINVFGIQNIIGAQMESNE